MGETGSNVRAVDAIFVRENLITDRKPLRILQVGLGNRGRMWAEIIGRRSDVVHAGVVDVDAQRIATLGVETGLADLNDLPGFTDLGTALAAGEYDAVLLVTPPDGHLAQARAIFDAGLPLLSEKPLTLDLPQAVEIVALAEQSDLPLMVGLNFRYLPVSRKIRQMVAEQAYGAPGFAQFTYQRNRDGRLPRLNKYPLTMQHPMMLEQSIHHLDLIRFCYGREVEQIFCRTWNPAWSMYAHESNVSCLMTLEGGLEVNYLGTWTGGWDELQFEWRTDCSDGVIVQRKLFEDLAAARTGDEHVEIHCPSKTANLSTTTPMRCCRPLSLIYAWAHRWNAAATIICARWRSASPPSRAAKAGVQSKWPISIAGSVFSTIEC